MQMQSYKIILANESRFMRGMLKRVIGKTPDLEVVGEELDRAKLPHLVESLGAHWVIITLPENDEIPKDMTKLLAKNKTLAVLAIRDNGSRAKLKWMDMHETNHQGLSLKELIELLHKDLQ
jgi:chemotaxis response regulator CheB